MPSAPGQAPYTPAEPVPLVSIGQFLHKHFPHGQSPSHRRVDAIRALHALAGLDGDASDFAVYMSKLPLDQVLRALAAAMPDDETLSYLVHCMVCGAGTSVTAHSSSPPPPEPLAPAHPKLRLEP